MVRSETIEIIPKPWGKEEILLRDDAFIVKRITMNCGHRCSLQKHQKKREIVTVVAGELYLEIDGFERLMNVGDHATVEPGEVHRMHARGMEVVYIEASTAHPDDIVRIEDDYGRVPIEKGSS